MYSIFIYIVAFVKDQQILFSMLIFVQVSPA